MFNTIRLGFAGIFLSSLCFLAGAYSLEYGLGLEPCALCLLERYTLWPIAFVAGLAFLHHPDRLGTRLYTFALLLLNSLGVALAARHLWIQYGKTPDVIVPCSAGLRTLLQFKPLLSALAEVLRDSHDCAQIHRVLGLPLSLLSMMGFLAITFLLGWLFYHSRKPSAG